MPQDAEIVSLAEHRPAPIVTPAPQRSRRRWFRLTLVVLLILGIAMMVWRAIEANRAAQIAIDELTALTNNQELIDAVAEQNAATHALTLAQISALDRQYMADKTTGGGMVAELMARPPSRFLKEYADGAKQRIVLIILVDAKGLNAAVSRPTTDYYQGDEPKFQKTFPIGPGAVYWGELERDYSNRLMHVVSRTVTDPSTGDPIGALAIGFDNASLKR